MYNMFNIEVSNNIKGPSVCSRKVTFLLTVRRYTSRSIKFDKPN